MKKLFQLTCLLFVAWGMLASTPAMAQTIILNEFQADPAADITGDANGDGVRDSGDDEFVELVNVSAGDIDISGWTLADGYSVRHIFPASTVLSSGCAIVVFGGGTPTGTFGGATVQTASTGMIGLNNSGDTITLNNGTSDVFSYAYGSEGGDNQSITLDPDLTGTFVKHSTATGSGGALFSPGTMIDGSSFCGGPVNLPVVVNCDSPFNIMEGIGGVHQISASDADGTIVAIAITNITPVPTTGTITIGNFTAGDPATADVTVSPDVPAGQYSVEITGTNDDTTPQTGSCTLTVNVGTGWIINEFQADPASDLSGDANGDGVRDSSDDEFVELVNATGFDTDISGWTLADGYSVRHVFPSDTIIPDGCAIVIFGGGSPVGGFGGATVQTASDGSVGLNNAGDTITLSSGSTVQATIAYGSEGGQNQSVTLDPDLIGSFTLHSTATGSGGALFSPGTMVDGTTSFCTGGGEPVIVDCGGNMNAFVGIGGVHPVSASDLDNMIVGMAILVTPAPATGTITLEDFAASASMGDTATGDVVVSADVSEGVYSVTVMAGNDAIPSHAGRCYFTLSVISPRPIHEIQGNGLSSPYDGSGVYTQNNIVTAVGANGFYMQAPDADVDTDPDTSEGIYVYTGSAPTVLVGDIVDVNGTLVEYYELTEISSSPVVTLISSGNPLPTSVELDGTNPSPDQPQTGLEMERYECMLVHVANGTVNTGTDSYGNVLVTAASTRSFREPGIEYPGLPALPVWDGNPEIFEMDPDALGLPDQLFHGGTPFSATGVISYSYGEYQLQPTALTSTPSPYPVPVRDRQVGEFTVATQNMYRLFNNQDDGHTAYGEPILTIQEYANRLAKASRLIREVLKSPDILGVQEVETIGVLLDLAAQIHADDPSVNYTAYLTEGNDIGGIDIGILVRDEIQVNSVIQVEPAVTFDYNTVTYTLHDRPPLLLDGVYTGYGENFPVKVLVVHNRSFLGIDGSDAGRIKEKRWQQADHIAQYIQTVQVAEPGVRLVVMGDFNAYEFTDGYVDSVGIIKGDLDPLGAELPGIDHVTPDLTNQMLNLPAVNRYSYIHNGTAQEIDHILTSQEMNGFVEGIVPARANADAVAMYEYDLTTPETYSDHDGLVLFVRDLSSVHLSVNFIAAANGSISGNTAQQVLYGQDSTPVTAVRDTGNVFTNWTGDYAGTANPLTLTNVIANMDITANFTIQTFIISASAGANGNISPGGTMTVNYGDSQTFLFSPDVGYHVSDVVVDGTSVGTAGHHTFVNIQASHTVSVTFSTNIPPVIDSFTADGSAGNAPLTVNFICMAHDPDGGGIVQYLWEITGKRADTA
ncbi:MAG: lamin tail domain-containing protein, partial [Holophagae bacterium]|nr:lamin tail domain-containing protein [Holophagae bacterium]